MLSRQQFLRYDAQQKAQRTAAAPRPACWHRKAETAFLLALSLLLLVLAAIKA